MPYFVPGTYILINGITGQVEVRTQVWQGKLLFRFIFFWISELAL
jgi:hypothetical protein